MKVDLDELERLEKAATVGYWQCVRCPASLISSGGYFLGEFEELRNTAFITTSRNALPALLKEVRAAREWLKSDSLCPRIVDPDEDDMEDILPLIANIDIAREAYRSIVAENSK